MSTDLDERTIGEVRPARTVSGRTTLGRVPGLDGVRALAIALVLLFHGGVSWASGGFFGVDVFFVLSGFLITALLVAEYEASGAIRLGSFWSRRARRLLPALFLMLGAVGLYAVFLAPSGTLGQLRSDALSTLFYGANWNQVVTGQGYFAALSTPSPLVHTWSLAIEEQFYLLWPLVVLFVLRRSRRSLAPLLSTCLVGAAASALAMAVLYGGGAGATRVYYGTDTRAQDLLIGAALAVVTAELAARRDKSRSRGEQAGFLHHSPSSRAARAGLLLWAAGGTAFLLWATGAVGSTTSWPYRGGFVLVSLAAAGLIACVVALPKSPFGRLLSLRPVSYLGRISYGLYLWHWPVFLVLDSARLRLFGWELFSVRVAVAVALAACSYHLLEMPIRRGALSSWRAWAATPAAFTASAAFLLATTAGASAAPAGALVASSQTVPSGVPRGAVVSKGTGPAVAAVPAGTLGPVRVLLVGDSEASFLGFGLGPQGARHGVSFTDDGVIGCGLVPGETTLQGKPEADSYGIRGASTWVPCEKQYVRWRADLARFHPDVAMLADGEFEVRNHFLGHRWVHLGERWFDRREEAALVRAVEVLHSNGAAVVLLTAPYYASGGEQLNGSAWPEDRPGRVRIYNRLVREAAAGRPYVTVANLNAHLDPSGHYQQYVDGVQVRYSDGVHATPAGGRLVAPWLLGLAHRVGLANRRLVRQGARPPTTSSP